MKRALKWLVNIAATLAGAYALMGLFDSLHMNMPSFMDDGIRALLRVTGNDRLANTDDIESIALLVVLGASTLLAAAVVTVVNICIRRCAMRRRYR